MRNKFTIAYGVFAFLVIILAVAWFAVSLVTAVRDGTDEAQRSFAWITREATTSSMENGFMSGRFIEDLEGLCKKSRLLSALMVETPSGVVFVWPENTRYVSIGGDGKPSLVSSDIFRKVFSASMDIGDSAAGSVRMTAVINVLQPGIVFSASRNSFMLTLAVLLVTFIVIILSQPEKQRVSTIAARNDAIPATAFGQSPLAMESSPHHREPLSFGKESPSEPSALNGETPPSFVDSPKIESEWTPSDEIEAEDPGQAIETYEADTGSRDEGTAGLEATKSDTGEREETEVRPEGLYSPVTGIGWEQYLVERLDAELVRAASSEQDLALIILRVSGLLHSDLLARKIASMLLEIFSFRDMLFEYGPDGFAGILQNVNLDLAMKNAEKLFARIDETLIELSSDAGIAIGITTRTARLLPASRMIQEASMAAKKAQDEPNLPIVAFRANPEKYRAFVAENGAEG